MRTENLVLIGFMACGKSSVAKALALRLDSFFFDTDQLIEAKFQMSVKDIFKSFSEAFFRKEEQKLAHTLLDIKNAVIASGGGFIAVKNLKKLGKIIYLRADFDFLRARLKQDELDKRPLFKDEARARELFDTRKDLYESLADLSIDIKDKSIDYIAQEIIRSL